MRIQNRARNRWYLALALMGLLVFTLWPWVATAAGRAGDGPLADEPSGDRPGSDSALDAVSRRIEASDGYGFSATIEQTLIPRPLPQNIGQGAERLDTQVTGQVTLPDHAELTLRFEADLPPLRLEQEGTDTYLIQGGERTLIENPLGAAAPTGDFASYLHAAVNVARVEQSESPYTIYTFDLDGARYAEYVRVKIEQALPPDRQDARIVPSPLLQRMTGHGELWIDDTGLPRRQIVDVVLPEINDEYDAESHIVVDFDFRGHEAGSTSQGLGVASNPHLSPQKLPNAPILIPLLVLLFLVLLVSKPHRLRVPLSVMLVLIIASGPTLRSVAYAEDAKARAARPSLTEALGLANSETSVVGPIANRAYVDTASLSEVPAASVRGTIAASSIQDGSCGTGSTADDSDLDGLNDYVENCLGTDAYYYDSDLDQITDTLEVEGFIYGSQTWYADPFSSDSNDDGLSDYFEWPAPVGTADEWDPDGDGIPNLWDDDNDGDGVPDDLDLNPFIVTGYDDSFSFASTWGSSGTGSYQYIELQIQPEDDAHLRYTTTYLDWPYDEDGNIHDLDNSDEDVELVPMLKITTDNAPSDDLQQEYGLTVSKSGSTYTIYVLLSPLSDGGKITAFGGTVVYGPGDLYDIAWTDIELVWIAMMEHDEYSGDDVETESTPIVAYTENYRLTGLEVTKSGDADLAVMGTPNSPDDDRDLFQLLAGLNASYLTAASPDLAEVIARFSSPTTTITETWGVPVGDVALATPADDPDHYDELASSAAETILDFLDDNGYPTDGTMASVITLIEADIGVTSLADLDEAGSFGTSGVNSFTFNLPDTPVNTMRSVFLSQYENDGSGWDSMDSEEVAQALYERYGDDMGTILANLQTAYPDLDEADLYAILLGYVILWSTMGQSQMVTYDGVSLLDEEADEGAILTRYDLDGVSDLVTYLIESDNLAVIDGGLVTDNHTDYYTYIRSFFDVGWFIAGNVSSILFYSNYISQCLTAGTDNVVAAGIAYYATKIEARGMKMLASASATIDDFILGTADDVVSAATKASRGAFLVRYASRIATVIRGLGVVVSLALLGYEIYTIWTNYADYSSPYGYDEEFALNYAIVATVLAVIFFLLAFTVVGLVILIAIALATLIVYFLSKAVGDTFDFSTELVNALTELFFGSNTAYTKLLDLDFDGLKAKIDSDSLVRGSTLSLSDKFYGYIQRVSGSGNDQLDRSQSYAWFDAGTDDSSVTVSTSRGSSSCTIGYYIDYDEWVIYTNVQTCKNKLQADFEFNDAGINKEFDLLYKIRADTRYKDCGFANISCNNKTDKMYLPDELDDDDQWESVEISLDVLPDTLDGLWTWNPQPPSIADWTDWLTDADYWNSDRDGDDLTNSQEAILGTDPDDWDSDDDGLSDGFEMEVQEDAGTDPLDADTDDDGLADGLEYQLGTTINDSDSDDDGLSDGDEVFHWDGGAWTGGGWFVTIDGVDYWVFSEPLIDDYDSDDVDDGSEAGNGSSPRSANRAPYLTLEAGPYLNSPSGIWSVVVADGQPVTATLEILNNSGQPVTHTLTFCPPDALTGVNVTTWGDRTPATQQNGGCYEWDFSGSNLLFLQAFHAYLTATATAGTVAGEFTASLPYASSKGTDVVSEAVAFIQDNTAPAVQLTSPIGGARLSNSHYVLGGYSQDADSWVDRVEVTVPAGTSAASGTSPWAYTWALPAGGLITVQATAYDIVGNSNSDSIEVYVDTVPPVITSNLADGATISAGEALSTTFELSGTVSDNFGGLVRVQMHYNERPWSTIWETDTTPLNTTWSGTWELPNTESAQGEHKLYMRAYDDYGHIGTYSQTVFVDTLPPTNQFTNRQFTNDDPPHVAAGLPLTLYGVANDAGNNPLPADPAELTGTLHSIRDATVWLQPDTLQDDDSGVSLAWIGDMNGDRLGDLAVGLPAAANGAGEVTIVNGAAGDWPLPNVGGLEFLAANRPSYIGVEGAGIGSAIQPAGDFDADGFDDLLIGDPVNNRLFLVFGSTGDVGLDRQLDGDGGAKWIEIRPHDSGETIGTAFAPAGDVTNDARSDILVATTGAGGNKVYLVTGDISPYSPHYLDVLAGAVLDAGTAAVSVGGVGDVDDDLVDDFAIALDGTIYLFAGGGGWDQGDLSTLDTAQAIATFASADSQPTIVAPGDVNGDDIDDLAYSSGDTPVVVFGDAGQAFTSQVLSGFPSALSGFLVAAGDVDKDDVGDLLIGNAAGDAYLILGSDLSRVAATIEGVSGAASAPYASGADLAGDGSSDLLVAPSSAAAAALGYDTSGGALVRQPFISSDWLPRAGSASGGSLNAPSSVQLLAGGDVTVGARGADYTSIQDAIDSGADRVLIEPGVYAEVITLTNGVEVIGSGAGLTYLTFPGGTGSPGATVLVRADGIANATLMNVSLVGNGSETGLQVLNGATGISLARTIIRDMGTAVSLDGSGTELELKNNTLVGNVDGLEATNCAPVDVRSTLFAYNTGTALQYEGCAPLQRHQYNLYYANGTDMTPNDPGGGELFADPRFKDYGRNDFRTELDSPVIDAGAPGDPVPPGAGDAADIGYLEQTGSSFFADDNYCSTCENDGLIWGVDAFATIQDAVDAVEADLDDLHSATPVQFSVGVGSGTFVESVVISASLSLLGSNADESTIVGNGGPAVTFRSTANSAVSGFTLEGAGPNPVGVLITGGSNTVSVTYNLIQNNTTGISVTERSSGWGAFNTIVTNTIGVETGGESDTQYNWFDLENSIISHNDTGLLAHDMAVIFSDYNLLYNTALGGIDYSNVISGVRDIAGEDPLLTGGHAYLQSGSPALDAAAPWAEVPTGGGVRADLGWHELLAAPISIFMGQADDSIATESTGVAQVEYAIVAVSEMTSPITSTLPATWTLANLDDPGEKLTYWQTTITPTVDGQLYRIYSRATDDLGNTESDSDDWYDGAFVVDGGVPVITMTYSFYPIAAGWILFEGKVYDYVDQSFDVQEVYLEVDGERVDAEWDIEEWEADGVTPRDYHYFFVNDKSVGNHTFQAFAVDGAGQVGATEVITQWVGMPDPPFYDGAPPEFLSLSVSDDDSGLPPFDELSSGTVTFQGTANDRSGSGGLKDEISEIAGYEISFDGGASWDQMKSWGNTIPNFNFRYTWEVPGGFDATTIPVRIRVRDYYDNVRTKIVTLTIDTAPPRGFEPVDFGADFGMHYDEMTDVLATWHTPVDGSGTVYAKVLGGTELGVPAFDADGINWHVFSGDIGPYYATVGAKDAAGNISYEGFGPWYGSAIGSREGWWGNQNQTIEDSLDGVLDVDHNEWLPATEMLDDDDRPDEIQTLWTAWGGYSIYMGWQGAQWGANEDGTLWTYFDLLATGTTVPVTGSVTLPFDADLAVSVEDENTAYLWNYDGATWTARNFDTLTDWQEYADFRLDTGLDSTEIEFMPQWFCGCAEGTAGFENHRMVAFALDDTGAVWSAFPPMNDLDGAFDFYYDWNIVADHANYEWDLLNLPSSSQVPYATLALHGTPPAQNTLSTDETVQYLVDVTNIEDESVDGVQVWVTGSSGLSYQSVADAACCDCTAPDAWLLDLPTIASGQTHRFTVTALLDSDLSGLSTISTTARISSSYTIDVAATLSHDLDLDAPDIAITHNPGNVIGAGAQRVRGSADDGDGAGVALVEVSTDGNAWQTASGTTSWSADVSLPPGTTGDAWYLYARATDYHGQTGTSAFAYTLDTSAPLITPTIPALLGGRSVGLIGGDTRDPAPEGARVQKVAVQVDDDTARWMEATLYSAAAGGEQAWLYAWTLPSEDYVAHTLRFRATDYGRNVTTSQWFTTVVDTIAPQITVTLALTQVPLGSSSPALGGEIADGGSIVEFVALVYPETGPAIQETITVENGQWAYTLAQPLGTYAIYVQAEDAAGNVRYAGPYQVEVTDAAPFRTYLPLIVKNGDF